MIKRTLALASLLLLLGCQEPSVSRAQLTATEPVWIGEEFERVTLMVFGGFDCVDSCLERLNQLLLLEEAIKQRTHLAWVNLDGPEAVNQNRARLYSYLEEGHGISAQVYTPSPAELAYLDQSLELGGLTLAAKQPLTNDTLFVLKGGDLVMSFTREVSAEHIQAALALLLEDA